MNVITSYSIHYTKLYDLPADQDFTPWLLDPSIFAEDQGDRIEMRRVSEQEVQTVKLDNLVPPILFRLGEAEIPENYLELLRGVLDRMRDRTRNNFV